MSHRLRVFAVVLWMASLVSPASHSEHGVVLGIQAAGAFLVLLLAAFPISLLTVLPPFSMASNLLLLREIWALLIGRRGVPMNAWLCGSVAVINAAFVFFFMSEVMSRSQPAYRYPSVYLWIGSFFLLWLAAVTGSAGAFDSDAMVPNPSIERTVAGKPAPAAHVER